MLNKLSIYKIIIFYLFTSSSLTTISFFLIGHINKSFAENLGHLKFFQNLKILFERGTKSRIRCTYFFQKYKFNASPF